MAKSYRYAYTVRYRRGLSQAWQRRRAFLSVEDALWYIADTMQSASDIEIERIQMPKEMRLGDLRRRMEKGPV